MSLPAHLAARDDAGVEPPAETPTRASRPERLLRPGPLRNRGWVRKLHAVIGLIASLNLLLLLITGFLLQHRDGLRLDERTVSRSLLPASYRAQDGSGGVRADIVVTDLHSGRLFGSVGTLVLDGITLAWFVLLLSGLYLFALGWWRNNTNRNENGRY